MYGLFNKVYGSVWVGDVNITTAATFTKQGYGVGMTAAPTSVFTHINLVQTLTGASESSVNLAAIYTSGDSITIEDSTIVSTISGYTVNGGVFLVSIGGSASRGATEAHMKLSRCTIDANILIQQSDQKQFFGIIASVFSNAVRLQVETLTGSSSYR